MGRLFKGGHGVFPNTEAQKSENDTEIKLIKSTFKEWFIFLLVIIVFFILIITISLEKNDIKLSLPENKKTNIKKKLKPIKKTVVKPASSWAQVLEKLKQLETLRAGIYAKISEQQDPKIKAEGKVLALLPTPSFKLPLLPMNTSIKLQTLPVLQPFPPLPNIKIALLNEFTPIKLAKTHVDLLSDAKPATTDIQAVFMALQQSFTLQQAVLHQLLAAQKKSVKIKQPKATSADTGYDFFANTVYQRLQIRQKPLASFALPDRAAKPLVIIEPDPRAEDLSGI